MRIITSNIFRAACSLFVGLLFVFNAERMPSVMVQIVGGLFLVSAMFSLVGNIWSRFSPKALVKPSFPLMSIGSAIFGIYLICFPELFITYLAIIMGVLLVIAGAGTIISGISYQRIAPISIVTLIMPFLLLAFGLYIIFNPMETVATTFRILGYACIYYGIMDLFMALRYRHYQRIYKHRDSQEDAQQSAGIDAEYVEYEEVKDEK